MANNPDESPYWDLMAYNDGNVNAYEAVKCIERYCQKVIRLWILSLPGIRQI